MTPDQYVEAVLGKYAVPRGPTSPAELFGATVAGPLRTWAGQQLVGLEYSGSYAKETGVRGISDVDVFISLESDTDGTLKEIYEKLVSLANNSGWLPRRQNVSVGVTQMALGVTWCQGEFRQTIETTTVFISANGNPGRKRM